jgi:membrane protein YqaA with SNARE-associated domain
MLLPSATLAFIAVWRWVLRLGGPGLILLGILDNSIVPLTGSMDVLTIWLAASHKDLWLYYAFMATIGGVVGGYITYAIARKGGKETIERKLDKNKAEKVMKRFRRWSFWSVAVGAILPPPFPLVPVLVAAGGSQYSRWKFTAALTLGRAVRYCIVAFFGRLYGRQIVNFFSHYYKPAALVLGGMAVIGGIITVRKYLKSRKKDSDHAPRAVAPSKAA